MSILNFVQNYQPDSRQRIRACMVAGALAKFAKIEIDLKPYRGKYNSAILPKDIPSDRQISEWYYSIPNQLKYPKGTELSTKRS